MKSWKASRSGRQQQYANLAIVMILTRTLLFYRTLRQTVGQIDFEKCLYTKALTMNSCSGIYPQLETNLWALVGRTSFPLLEIALRRDC